MQDHLPAPTPEPRSPRAIVRAMNRNAVCVEAVVALLLVLSICALLYLGVRTAVGLA